MHCLVVKICNQPVWPAKFGIQLSCLVYINGARIGAHLVIQTLLAFTSFQFVNFMSLSGSWKLLDNEAPSDVNTTLDGSTYPGWKMHHFRLVNFLSCKSRRIIRDQCCHLQPDGASLLFCWVLNFHPSFRFSSGYWLLSRLPVFSWASISPQSLSWSTGISLCHIHRWWYWGHHFWEILQLFDIWLDHHTHCLVVQLHLS